MRDSNPGPFMLGSTGLIIAPDAAVTPKDYGDRFYEELDRDFDGFRGHWLVQKFEFSNDWPTWEVHPNGDEIVILLSGEATFVLRKPDGSDVTVDVDRPGMTVVVPRNTWHTARTNTPCAMLFVTPGEGTENAERPG